MLTWLATLVLHTCCAEMYTSKMLQEAHLKADGFPLTITIKPQNHEVLSPSLIL